MLGGMLREKLLDGSLKATHEGAAGHYKGYPIIIDHDDRSDEFVIKISVCSSKDPENQKFQEYWKPKTINNPKILLLIVEPYHIEFVIKPGLWEWEKVEMIDSFTESIIEYLMQNEYNPCCRNCGSTFKKITCYEIKNDSFFLCESCFEEEITKQEIQKKERASQKANYLQGIVGGIFCGLIACIMYVYLLVCQSRIHGGAGLLISVFFIGGYKKLGKVLDLRGILSCFLFLIFAIYTSTHIGWSIIYLSDFQAQYSFNEIVWNLFSILNECGDLQVFKNDLIIGYLLSGISSIPMIIGSIIETTGFYYSNKRNI